MKKAVILLSGGLDSTTCLALAQSEGYQCYALSFYYGQKQRFELEAAARIARSFHVDHKIITLDTALFQGSALTDAGDIIPEYCSSTAIPSTYVPARNTVFLALALSFAEGIGARALFIGASSVDYSHYPDCRPEFIDAFQRLANLATKAGVEGDFISIRAPLQHLSKAKTIELGQQLNVDYSLTVSCYQVSATGEACGACASCFLRQRGFVEAHLPDPTSYKK